MSASDPTATSAVPIECANLNCHDAMAREGLRRISPNVTSSRHLTAKDADLDSSARVSKVVQPEPHLSCLPRRWHPEVQLAHALFQGRSAPGRAAFELIEQTQIHIDSRA